MKTGDQQHRARVYVYVDGFNFYYATKWTDAYPYGWCNWRLTAENYCGQSREVVHVKYFTSEIVTTDADKRRRQKLHIAAMKTEGEVILGRFANREYKCRKCGLVEQSSREKRTDTNIAVQMVLDAATDQYEEAFLVTADEDLLPAIEMVTDERNFQPPRKVTVLFPPGAHVSREFRSELNRRHLVRSIELRTANMVRFPRELATKLGFEFPKRWNLGSTGPSLTEDQDFR